MGNFQIDGRDLIYVFKSPRNVKSIEFTFILVRSFVCNWFDYWFSRAFVCPFVSFVCTFSFLFFYLSLCALCLSVCTFSFLFLHLTWHFMSVRLSVCLFVRFLCIYIVKWKKKTTLERWIEHQNFPSILTFCSGRFQFESQLNSLLVLFKDKEIGYRLVTNIYIFIFLVV